MRQALWAVVLAAVCVGTDAWATTVAPIRLECPACGGKFQSWVAGSSFVMGSDFEGRPQCGGMDFQEFRIHGCPKCHYAGMGYTFGKGNAVPSADQIKAIREALARDGKALPQGALWPLEKVRAAEICLLARRADQGMLVDLYMLGAWLADDAAEDELAAQYRDKALESRVKWAAFKDPALEADCLAALRAGRAGQYEQAGKLCEKLAPRLEAEAKSAETEAAKAREAAGKRHEEPALSIGGRPPSPAPAATGTAAPPISGSAEDDEPDAGPSLTPREQAAVVRPNVLGWLAGELHSLGKRAAFHSLGPAKALELAEGQGFYDRLEFIRAFGASTDPKIVEGIKRLIAQPYGPKAKNEDVTDEAWDTALQRFRGALEDTLDRMQPQAPKKEPKAEVAELAEHLRALKADEDASWTLNRLGEIQIKESADVLLADFENRLDLYAESHMAWGAFAVMALDEPRCIDLAQRMVKRVEGKELEPPKGVAALRPLAHAETPASLQFLKSLLESKTPPVRLEAARCLLAREDREGLKAILADAVKDPLVLEELEADAGAALLRLTEASDYDAYVALAKHWPGEIKRADNDKRAMAAITVRAALAKTKPDRHLKEYEQAIDQLVKSPVEGWEPFKTPMETVIPERLTLLGWCANIYYVPYIGRLMRPLLLEDVSEYGTAGVIGTLAAAGAQDMADALAPHLVRPAPIQVKIALAQTAGLIRLDGIEPALKRWSASRNEELAATAKEALERLAAHP